MSHTYTKEQLSAVISQSKDIVEVKPAIVTFSKYGSVGSVVEFQAIATVRNRYSKNLEEIIEKIKNKVPYSSTMIKELS